MRADRDVPGGGGRPTILGVINLSPESNVPGSHATDLTAVLRRAAQLCAQGADLVELGARSISPARARVSEAVEWQRLRPALAATVADGYRVAVDTWSLRCAQRALDAGATLINFTGADPPAALFAAVARHNATLCVLFAAYPDPYAMRDLSPVAYGIDTMLSYFRRLRARARRAGLHDLVFDPNLGIIHPSYDDATKIAYQIQAIQALPAIARLGSATLAYLARKSALTSRMLIAAQLAASGVDYVRAHEPAIALRAWHLRSCLPQPAPRSRREPQEREREDCAPSRPAVSRSGSPAEQARAAAAAVAETAVVDE